MAREPEHYREMLEYVNSKNGGKCADSDIGWQRALGISRRDFENIYGRKKGVRTIGEIAKGLL
jgi:hypothetical protein